MQVKDMKLLMNNKRYLQTNFAKTTTKTSILKIRNLENKKPRIYFDRQTTKSLHHENFRLYGILIRATYK